MSGIKLTSSRVKKFLALLAFASFFVYANVSAGTNEYKAEVTILPDGKLLPVLIRDIAEAKKSIYIAMYMFKSYDNVKNGAGLIKKSLINASERGLDVFIAMESSADDDFVEKENKKIGNELTRHGIRLVYDNPDQRMHTKCVVIDETITFIGSHNYTNSALEHNREMTVRIVSPEAAQDALGHIKSIK